MTISENLLDSLTQNRNGLDASLLRPALILLAAGEPVEITDLATAAGIEVNDLRARLADTPDTEYDDSGRIIGLGLTLLPTPHRFTVDGQELYTWCALDTLVFPTLIDKTAEVESASAGNGAAVRLTVTPTSITRVEPPTAVMSVVDLCAGESIRAAFCNQVHFFTSPDDAAEWLGDHPEAQVVPIAQAQHLAADLAIALGRVGATPASCAPATGGTDAVEQPHRATRQKAAIDHVGQASRTT